ncbi:hypothetical protein HDV00_010561 [Rhizophlyctis rosea]|nr:hypothetical protein HDV00_010561 [Rhizophlyctis rosea]
MPSSTGPTLPPIFTLRSHPGTYFHPSPYAPTSLTHFRAPLHTQADSQNRLLLHYQHGPIYVKGKGDEETEYAVEVKLLDGHDRCLLKCVESGKEGGEKYVGADVYYNLFVREKAEVMEVFHIIPITHVETVDISSQGILHRRYSLSIDGDKIAYKPAGDASPFEARLVSISPAVHEDIEKQKLDEGILFGVAFPGSFNHESQTPLSEPYAKTPISTHLCLLNDATQGITYAVAQATGKLSSNPHIRLPLLSVSVHLNSITQALVTEDGKVTDIPGDEKNEKKDEKKEATKDEEQTEKDQNQDDTQQTDQLPLLPLYHPTSFPSRLHTHIQSLVAKHKARTVLMGGEVAPFGDWAKWSKRGGEVGKEVEILVADGGDVERGVVEVVVRGGWLGVAGK